VKKLRILVVDDHEVVREGLRTILESQEGWDVCAEAATGREAIAKTKELKPHVVIMDISMPDMDGIEATRQIRQAVPGCIVLILTMHEPDELLGQVLEAGARGYVLKTDARQELISAVSALRAGKPYFSATVLEKMLDDYSSQEWQVAKRDLTQTNLTPREQEVLRLLAQGKSNKEVGASLKISVRTVESHRTNIMRKLDLHSITDLVHFAIRTSLIEPNG
jgi:DNA-binding NarL/FixJ family response regulator